MSSKELGDTGGGPQVGATKFCTNAKPRRPFPRYELKYSLFDVAGSGVAAAAAAAAAALRKMEKPWLAAALLGRKENLIHLFLASVFAALAYRSVDQQRQIEVLEAECGSLRATNKLLRGTMWNWKQQLLAEADESSPVPLSRLRAVYGEAARAPAPKGVGKTARSGPASPPQKLVI